MDKIVDVVDSIEIKLKKLLLKLEVLEQKNFNLEENLKQSAIIIDQQAEEINQFKMKNQTLKISNALLGSNENKKETKLKINSLIREIDYCISQLSD
jgi:hypothetical protein